MFYTLTEVRTNEDEGSLKLEIFANTDNRRMEYFDFRLLFNPEPNRNIPDRGFEIGQRHDILRWDKSTIVSSPAYTLSTDQRDEDNGRRIPNVSWGGNDLEATFTFLMYNGLSKAPGSPDLKGEQIPIFETTFQVTNRSQFIEDPWRPEQPFHWYLMVWMAEMTTQEGNMLINGRFAESDYRVIHMPPPSASKAIVNPLSLDYISPFNSAIQNGKFQRTITYNGVESITVEITANTVSNTLEGWLFFLMFDTDELELVSPSAVWSPLYNQVEESTDGQWAVYGRRRFSVDWRSTVGMSVAICKVVLNRRTGTLNTLPRIQVHYMIDVKQENYAIEPF